MAKRLLFEKWHEMAIWYMTKILLGKRYKRATLRELTYDINVIGGV